MIQVRSHGLKPTLEFGLVGVDRFAYTPRVREMGESAGERAATMSTLSIRFACPTCNKKLGAALRLAGRAGHCPRCNGPVCVPDPLADTPEPPLSAETTDYDFRPDPSPAVSPARTVAKAASASELPPIPPAAALASEPPSGQQLFRKGDGCSACRGTGYKGRFGIHELLVSSEGIRGAIYKKRPVGEIRDIALAEGMSTLKQDGIQKVIAGATDLEQIVTAADR